MSFVCLAALVPVAAQVAGHGAAPVAEVRVDPELTRQLDAAGPGTRVVAFVHGTDIDAARAAARRDGLTPVYEYARVGVVAVAGVPAAIRAVRDAPGVTYVEANRELHYGLDTSHRATRGEQARTLFQRIKRPGTDTPAFRTPIDGRGVTIAINDSGVDASHPFFRRSNGRSKVLRNLRFACTDEIYDFSGDRTVCSDVAQDGWYDSPNADSDSGTGGHGTHVAGIAAGVDVRLPEGKRLHGAAPGANLVVLSSGAGLNILSATGGLNWVLEHHRDPCGNRRCAPIRVVNNSWGPDGGDFNAESLIGKLSNALVRAGVVVVFSAGNGGGNGGTNAVNPYAQNPTPGVIGVANYDDLGRGTREGALDSSSSRGERRRPATFPDVAAPGTNILSSCRPTMPICTGGDPHDGGDYDVISGTSMAAPHVAGIVAQLLQVRPDLTPKQVEDVLEDTAYKFRFGSAYVSELSTRNDGLTSFDKGHGLVDVVAAIARVLHVDAGSPPATSCTADRVPSSTTFADPAGDAGSAGSRNSSDAATDVRRVTVTATSTRLTLAIDVTDLADRAVTGDDYFETTFIAGTAAHAIEARLDALGTATFDYITDDARIEVPGTWDAVRNRITVRVPTRMRSSDGSLTDLRARRLGGFAVQTGDLIGFVIALRDNAAGGCPVVVPGATLPSDIVDAVLKVGGAVHRWSDGPHVDAFDLGGECDLALGGCNDEFLHLRVPDEGAVLALDVAADPVSSYEVTVRDPSGRVVFRKFTDRVRLVVRRSGIYEVTINPYEAAAGEYSARAALLRRSTAMTHEPSSPTDDALSLLPIG